MTTESKRGLRHVSKALDEMVWAITAPMLATIQEVYGRRLAGERLEQLELDERLADTRRGHEFEPLMIDVETRGARAASGNAGTIAVLPLYGVMMPRATLFQEMSGGTSVEQYMAAFKSAVNDPNVTAILLDVDSPGGSSDLIAELGQCIYDARGTKPIAAVANTHAGSGACWVACQCDEVAVTPSGMIGSIGVYGTHTDLSAALEKAGIKPTTIQYGKYKTELSPTGPLSEDARAYVQSIVDEMGAMFVQAVARGRGVASAKVAADFGEGRMLTAKAAVKAGLADRVATYDEMLARLAKGAVTSGKPTGLRSSNRIEVEIAATDPLQTLLAGAHATALEAGNEHGPLVIKLDADVTQAHLAHLAERVAPLAGELGRKIVVLAKGHKLSVTPDDDRGATQESSATADEPTQPSGPTGLLHRRAVRAALRPAEASAKEE